MYYQPDRVDDAVRNFMLNLAVSVGIVIVVLMFAMGLRSGLLISSGLVFTIMGTLIVMLAIGLPLHRVSLAAIILAMGMLVDNAIVVADGILVDLKSGIERNKAFINTAKKNSAAVTWCYCCCHFSFPAFKYVAKCSRRVFIIFIYGIDYFSFVKLDICNDTNSLQCKILLPERTSERRTC